MKTSYVVRLGIFIGLLCLTVNRAFAVDLLKDILDTRKIDYARIEQKWGYLYHAILRLNLDEKNWEGGDSTTIYAQNNLTNWRLEEKRLLTVFLFLNFRFTEREVSAIANMLGGDALTIASQLATINQGDIAVAIARHARSQFTAGVTENFRRNVRLLTNRTRTTKSDRQR